jgi:hypothetical protein
MYTIHPHHRILILMAWPLASARSIGQLLLRLVLVATRLNAEAIVYALARLWRVGLDRWLSFVRAN